MPIEGGAERPWTTPLNAELMHELRSRVLAVTEQHEKETHDGKACWPERCNIVAWIAHSLGVQRQDTVRFMLRTLEEYARDCQNRSGNHTDCQEVSRTQ